MVVEVLEQIEAVTDLEDALTGDLEGILDLKLDPDSAPLFGIASDVLTEIAELAKPRKQPADDEDGKRWVMFVVGPDANFYQVAASSQEVDLYCTVMGEDLDFPNPPNGDGLWIVEWQAAELFEWRDNVRHDTLPLEVERAAATWRRPTLQELLILTQD